MDIHSLPASLLSSLLIVPWFLSLINYQRQNFAILMGLKIECSVIPWPTSMNVTQLRLVILCPTGILSRVQ